MKTQNYDFGSGNCRRDAGFMQQQGNSGRTTGNRRSFSLRTEYCADSRHGHEGRLRAENRMGGK